jgi:microcystin-dependent protein
LRGWYNCLVETKSHLIKSFLTFKTTFFMDIFIGSICAFGFNFAPYQWAQCNGQIVSIQQYTALFALLGTAYGGNGTSTFGLPDLIGKVANCQGSNGSSTYEMGETGGTDTVTLNYNNLPNHNHNLALDINCFVPVFPAKATSKVPASNYISTPTGTPKPYGTPATAGYALKPSVSITLGNTGGSPVTPVNIQDPILVMNYCIALYGIYPTRN